MRRLLAAVGAFVCAGGAVAGMAAAPGYQTAIGGPAPVPLRCRIGAFCFIVLPPGEHLTGKHLEDPVDFELDDDTIGSGAKLSAVLIVKIKSDDAVARETDALVTTDGPIGVFHVHIVRDPDAPETAAIRFANVQPPVPPREDAYAAIRRIRAEEARERHEALVAQAAHDAAQEAADAAAARAAARMPCISVVDNAYRPPDVQDASALFVPTRVWNDGKHTCIVIPPGAYDLPIVMVGGPGNSEETVNFRFDAANRMFVVDGTPSRVILIDGSGRGGRRVVVAHR